MGIECRRDGRSGCYRVNVGYADNMLSRVYLHEANAKSDARYFRGLSVGKAAGEVLRIAMLQGYMPSGEVV